MKTTFGLLSAVIVATSLVAQTVTNPPTSAPAETPPGSLQPTNTSVSAAETPAKKSTPKKRAVRKTVKRIPELKSMPLVPGPAVVVVNHLNVRGQAKLHSEVVARLTKDAVVTVLEEITLKHSAPDEPSAWAKIALPSDAHVWIHNSFVDANKKVTARKLNLRAGPGENYSVLGLILRGEEVKPINTKEDWIEIEAPTNTHAFVAAQYLRQLPAEAPTPPPTVVATPTPETVTPPVAETPKPATAPVETAHPQPTETVTTPPPAANPQPPVVTAPPPPVVAAPTANETPTVPAATAEQPLPPRVVQREGIVRGTVSIQAPSHFELMNPENKKAINYLFTPSADLDLRRWKGLHVMVTGEEGLDARWPNTPVLTIQKIEVLDEP